LDAQQTELLVARLEEAFDRLGRYLTAAAAAYLDEAPGPMLSGSQRFVLRTLADRGPCQMSEVAHTLGVTLSAATGLVDRLVKSNLATRERDAKDRRVVWVKITPEGRQAVAMAERRRRAALSRLIADLSPEDLATLCDIIERIGQRRNSP
jgi:DNA-binding MarR family transcriptional regulator